MKGPRLACPFQGCVNRAHGRDLCTGHAQQRKLGRELAPIGTYMRRPRKNRVAVENPGSPATKLIPLTKGQFAIVDDDVADRVSMRTWTAHKSSGSNTYYASTVWRRPDDCRTTMSLHRFLWSLWKLPETPDIDHKNRNGLDCRRENLRAATSSQNLGNTAKKRTNTSGFKGVYWHRKLNKWFAQITCNGKQRHLGCFAEKEAAADAYIRAAKELFGEFARAA